MQNIFSGREPAPGMTGLWAEWVEILAVNHDFSAPYLFLRPPAGNVVMYQLTVKISIF
jgi:hypothetical protein